MNIYTFFYAVNSKINMDYDLFWRKQLIVLIFTFVCNVYIWLLVRILSFNINKQSSMLRDSAQDKTCYNLTWLFELPPKIIYFFWNSAQNFMRPNWNVEMQVSFKQKKTIHLILFDFSIVFVCYFFFVLMRDKSCTVLIINFTSFFLFQIKLFQRTRFVNLFVPQLN